MNIDSPHAQVTAKSILIETIVENPKVFGSDCWISIDALRDDIIHRFDIQRLNSHYATPVGVYQALVSALKALPWIETVGDGTETKFRVKKIPNILSGSLNELVVELCEHRRLAAKWKDVALQVTELTISSQALKASMLRSETTLHRTAALAFHYRAQLFTFLVSAKRETGKMDPTPEMIEGIVADPAKFAEVKKFGRIHGVLAGYEG